MVYNDDHLEIVAEDQPHRTCVSIEHCAARNAKGKPREEALREALLEIANLGSYTKRAPKLAREALAALDEPPASEETP
ncbi:hypothetical protein LCGC14_2053940 [marine sediment metagenome]|uniref:Uncharacterized protein n=1 Tax=marine sediment metagenome TaxID=412755 RepID=A0A0F9H1L9_9ZZZZ